MQATAPGGIRLPASLIRGRRRLSAMTFDVAADAYDAFMGRYSRPLSTPFADLAGVTAGQRVLDVGCGTGMLTGELVARVGAANVVAIDPSTPFVAAMRTRFPGVEVHQAGVNALPFANGTFDAALAQLVVHFLSDPVGGIREMARVTRPGGVVVASVWDHAGGQGPLGVFWAAAHDLDPDVKDESVMPGAAEGHLASLFRDAELREVREGTVEARREHATFEEWWEPFTRGVGPAGAYVAGLDPAARNALREACRARQPQPPFTVTAVAWTARGTVPDGPG
jgi:SAM-dependent methyltransferase